MYKGSVSNILDFGCFVELQGFKSRQEGLVHITNLSKTRYVMPLLVLPWSCLLVAHVAGLADMYSLYYCIVM